ncbi:MAG: hypothetical protein PHN45_00275 [Methylococcales bacterium]|nr:hypothetical protein [Methylococcales bacterium]
MCATLKDSMKELQHAVDKYIEFMRAYDISKQPKEREFFPDAIDRTELNGRNDKIMRKIAMLRKVMELCWDARLRQLIDYESMTAVDKVKDAILQCDEQSVEKNNFY